MRLIDADVAKEALRNRISENIDECINNVPTVDVLEQIRAEIKQEYDDQGNWSFNDGLAFALEIVDKYR